MIIISGLHLHYSVQLTQKLNIYVIVLAARYCLKLLIAQFVDRELFLTTVCFKSRSNPVWAVNSD
jgi:hypothetical protein